MSVEVTGRADSVIERARLALLVDNLSQAILIETPQRRVARTNQAFCSMFHVPAPPEALVGGDCVEAARSLAPLLGDIEGFLSRVDDLIRDWRTVTDERITLTDGRLLERDFLPVTHTDGSREIAWVYRDVTEWEVLRARAESSAQQNADLLTAISHDVRTPVTGIVGLVELLQSQPLDDRTRQIVEGVRQSAASLTTMLDDFLDAARADAGLLEVTPQATPVAALVESVTDMVAPLARAKGLLLVTGTAPEVPDSVLLDPGRVRQVLLNMVSNAVKYTTEGIVALTTSVEGQDLVFTCQDTGPGLGDQQADVFGAFVRGSAPAARSVAGAGLGLAIAGKLADVMGGSLRVAQTGPEGSTFVLRLPLAAAGAWDRGLPLAGLRVAVTGPPLAVAALSQSVERAGAEIVMLGADVTVVVGAAEVPPAESGRQVLVTAVEPFQLPSDAPGMLSAPTGEGHLIDAILGLQPEVAGPSLLSPLPPGRRVLIVEDDPTNRSLIARMLEVLGVRAMTAPDGLAAVEHVTRESVDAVLMDIHLPGLDGIAATDRIRRLRNKTGMIDCPSWP